MPPVVAAMAPTGLVWQLLTHVLAGPGGLTAAATTTALVLLAVTVVGAMQGAVALGLRLPLSARDRALHQRAARTAFLSQRDPDARGRRRPRAPSVCPAAALVLLG